MIEFSWQTTGNPQEKAQESVSAFGFDKRLNIIKELEAELDKCKLFSE